MHRCDSREPQKLPVTLSADEIVRFLESIPGLRNRTALTTTRRETRRMYVVRRVRSGQTGISCLRPFLPDKIITTGIAYLACIYRPVIVYSTYDTGRSDPLG